jgi:DNA-binding transcriptional ArsR family regulator
VNRRSAVDRTLVALADPARRRAVELLGQRPHRAGELASALGLPAPATSRHLKALKQAELVAERFDPGDARVRIYTLRPETLGALKAWLAEAEDLWATRLEALARHLEAEK